MVRRSVQFGVGAAAAALLLSGCSHPAPIIRGTGGPATAPGASSSAPAPAALLTGGPLTARDLPGWKDIAAPASLGPDWLSVCGPTGVAASQVKASAAAVTGPGGVLIMTRVASYSDGNGAAKALYAVQSALDSCSPAGDTPPNVQTMDSGTDPVSNAGVITYNDGNGPTGESAGYRIAQIGTQTIEVYVQGSFQETLGQPAANLAVADILPLAIAKASSKKVPALSLPPLKGSPELPSSPATTTAPSGGQTTGGSTGPSTGGAITTTSPDPNDPNQLVTGGLVGPGQN